MGLAELVDEHFVPHKNWDGMSLGKVLSGWLTHILSEGDHRLNQVQDWAAKRAETLKTCLSSDVRALDFADDPLYILAIDQVRASIGRHGLLFLASLASILLKILGRFSFTQLTTSL